MTHTHPKNETPPAVDARPSIGGAVSVIGDWFGWFHRKDWPRDDHVIALCAGHKYLTEKGRWKSGPGDMPDLPPASGCCVCDGHGPTPRMRNAPLKPNRN